MKYIPIAMAVGLLILTGSGQAGTLTNPSFETGNLTGWTSDTSGGGSVQVTDSYMGWAAPAGGGTYFAVITSGAFPSASSTGISQSLTLHAGGQVSFEYFFTNSSQNSQIVAQATLALAGGSTSTLLNLVGGADQTPTGAWLSYVSSPVPIAGTYTLRFTTQNASSSETWASLGVDKVNATGAMPEPMTVLATIMGIGGVAGYLRRRNRI